MNFRNLSLYLGGFLVLLVPRISPANEKDLVQAIFNCDFPEVSKIVETENIDLNSPIKGNVFPGGETPISLLKFSNCNEPIKNQIKELLITNGSSGDPLNNKLLSNLNISEEISLFKALDKCDLPQIEHLIRNGVDPNTRFAGKENPFLQGFTPIAYGIASFCDEKRLYEPEVFQSFKERKKKLISKLIELGGNPNLLVPTDWKKYVPSFRIGYYTDFSSDYATELAVHAIKLGANPNSFDSRFSSVLSDTQISQANLGEIRSLINAGVDFNVLNYWGFNQTSEFPFWYLSAEENKMLFTEQIKIGLDFKKTNLEQLGSNSFLRTIVNTIYKSQEFNQANIHKELNEIRDLYLKPFPYLVELKAGKNKQTPLMCLMRDLCPQIDFNNQVIYKFKGIIDANPLDILYRNKAYNWFLNFLQTVEFDPEINDIHGNNLISYALHLCPNEVVKILKDRGVSLETAIKKEPVEQFFQVKTISGVTIPFNNDYRNYEFFKSLFDIEKSNLPKNELNDPRIIPISLVDSPLILPWKKTEDFGLEKDGFLNLKVRLTLNYQKHKNETMYKIEVKNIKDGQVFECPNLGPLVSFRYREIGKGILWPTFNSFPTDRGVKFSRKDGKKISWDIIGSPRRNRDFNRIEGGEENIIIEARCADVLKEDAEISKQLELKVNLLKGPENYYGRNWEKGEYIINSSDIHFGENVFPKNISNKFDCLGKYCDLISLSSGPYDAVKFLKLDIDSLLKEDSLRSFVFKFNIGNEKQKRDLLDQVKDEIQIEYSQILPSFIDSSSIGQTTESINALILKTLLRISSYATVNYDWKELVPKVEGLSFSNREDLATKELILYLFSNKDREESLENIISTPLSRDELSVIAKNLSDRYPPLRNKFKNLLNRILEIKDINSLKQNINFTQESFINFKELIRRLNENI